MLIQCRVGEPNSTANQYSTYPLNCNVITVTCQSTIEDCRLMPDFHVAKIFWLSTRLIRNRNNSVKTWCDFWYHTLFCILIPNFVFYHSETAYVYFTLVLSYSSTWDPPGGNRRTFTEFGEFFFIWTFDFVHIVAIPCTLIRSSHLHQYWSFSKIDCVVKQFVGHTVNLVKRTNNSMNQKEYRRM